MTFDYLLRPGIATTSNAIRLLEIVGLQPHDGRSVMPVYQRGEIGCYPPVIMGNICRTMVMAAGPTRTTKMPGKMNSTSGKISLTAVLAAFSSAS